MILQALTIGIIKDGFVEIDVGANWSFKQLAYNDNQIDYSIFLTDDPPGVDHWDHQGWLRWNRRRSRLRFQTTCLLGIRQRWKLADPEISHLDLNIIKTTLKSGDAKWRFGGRGLLLGDLTSFPRASERRISELDNYHFFLSFSKWIRFNSEYKMACATVHRW